MFEYKVLHSMATARIEDQLNHHAKAGWKVFYVWTDGDKLPAFLLEREAKAVSNSPEKTPPT